MLLLALVGRLLPGQMGEDQAGLPTGLRPGLRGERNRSMASVAPFPSWTAALTPLGRCLCAIHRLHHMQQGLRGPSVVLVLTPGASWEAVADSVAMLLSAGSRPPRSIMNGEA